MNTKIRYTLFLFVSIIISTYCISSHKLIAMQDTDIKREGDACIVPYDDQRDRQAIVSILDQYPHYLRYETIGKPAGTTEKYLTSPKYFTFVLRKDNKTIGFINYVSYENYILTFYLGRNGLIHLMGVENNNQKNGYGTLLLEHAINHLQELNTPNILIAVKADNTAAQKLYKKAGFNITPKIPGIPDLFCTKKLNVDKTNFPKGNIIQRHPKISACLTIGTIAALIYLLKH